MTDPTTETVSTPEAESWRRGDWIQTYTGRAFWPASPTPEDIDIADIAHALSNLCRYHGHVERFYSVAEHSVHVATYLERTAGPWVALQGLLHDATEPYVNDLARPVKRMLPAYVELEGIVWVAVAQHFGLEYDLDPRVKEADTRILMDERTVLLKPPPIAWRTDLEPLGVQIDAWSPPIAKARFLDRYRHLTTLVEKGAR